MICRDDLHFAFAPKASSDLILSLHKHVVPGMPSFGSNLGRSSTLISGTAFVGFRILPIAFSAFLKFCRIAHSLGAPFKYFLLKCRTDIWVGQVVLSALHFSLDNALSIFSVMASGNRFYLVWVLSNPFGVSSRLAAFTIRPQPRCRFAMKAETCDRKKLTTLSAPLFAVNDERLARMLRRSITCLAVRPKEMVLISAAASIEFDRQRKFGFAARAGFCHHAVADYSIGNRAQPT
jgi:hypothetical protein